MRRSGLEMIIDLFSAIERHPKYSIYRICGVANLNYARGYKMVREFNDKGFLLLESKQLRNCARLTTKGRKWLREIQRLIIEIVGEETKNE